MASQALYRKYRPQVWDDVVSQDQVVHVLKNAIRTGRVGHAYLFSGPRGTGKTTVARILARAVNCLDTNLDNRPCDKCENCIAVNEGHFMDLIEIDAASNTSVDDIRELRDNINFSPVKGRMKVYIIDEVHMLSTAAFNALLKTLEEPPSHAMFILATTEIHKIPATVLSRCQHHEFRRIPVTDIVNRLQDICSKENIKCDPDALKLVARQSTGAMRDAISMLDQLASAGEEITLTEAQNVLGTATNQAVVGLADAIINRDPAAGLTALHNAMDSGTDSRQLARQTVDYMRQLLILRIGTNETLEISAESRAQMLQQAQKVDPDRLVKIIQDFNEAAVDSRLSWHPGLNLELALTKCCEPDEKPQQTVQVIRQVVQVAADKKESSETNEIDVSDDSALPVNKIFTRKGETPDPTVTMADIKLHWNEVRNLLRANDKLLDASLNHASLLDVKNGVLYLGFPRQTIKNKVETNIRLMRWTSAAISKFVGKNVGVTCTIIGNSDSPNINVESGSLVDTALQLGGKLVVNKNDIQK